MHTLTCNFKLIGGSLLSYLYNSIITYIPSRKLRNKYLYLWLNNFGENNFVQQKCIFLNGRKISMGGQNVINFGCVFDGRKYPIHIGCNVSLGPEAVILTLGHDPQSSYFCDIGGEVNIHDHVWVGYQAMILPGITIGEGAVVGARSVVTKNVSPYTIVAGNPAKKIGDRNNNLLYELNYNPWLL